MKDIDQYLHDRMLHGSVMTHKDYGVRLTLVLLGLLLAACSSARHSIPPRATPTTQAQLRTAPRQCERIDRASLATADRSVVLDASRSVTTDIAGNRIDIHCVYNESTSKVEAGTISLTSYTKTTDARSAYDSARQTDTAMGMDLRPETYGQGAFAVSQGSSWTCLILSDAKIASAAVSGADATAACHWAQLGLNSL